MTNTWVLGIDPGTRESALLLYNIDAKKIEMMAIEENSKCFDAITKMIYYGYDKVSGKGILAIEQVRSYGSAIGAETLDTVHWCGRFDQFVRDRKWPMGVTPQIVLVPRKDVKMHVCNTSRATDSNVNHALADMFGGMSTCKGTKKEPGPCYGINNHTWAALALSVTVGNNLNAEGIYETDISSRRRG